MNGRGWWDIGYHFLIDSSGHIIEGRPENVEGSHTEGFNKDNLGIATMIRPPVSGDEVYALLPRIRELDSWRPPLQFSSQISAVLSHSNQPILWDALSPR